MAIIPAISIREPWASMIASGEKTLEIRTWATGHRGKIILCASKKPCGRYAGQAFALADLVNIRPMTPDDAKKAGGFFIDGAFAWELANIRPFRPFPITGKLGIFKIDTEKRASIKA